jgi:hypothetical protein
VAGSGESWPGARVLVLALAAKELVAALGTRVKALSINSGFLMTPILWLGICIETQKSKF